MSKLILPHGSRQLKPLLLQGSPREEERKKAENLKRVPMTTRETSDLIMMGIGAFTPLEGFMGRDDGRGCCETFSLPSNKGLFWPIPITVSAAEDLANSITVGEEVALWDTETESIMGTMKVADDCSYREHYSAN